MANDTDVFTIMFGCEKLNGLTLLIAWSNEKWIKYMDNKELRKRRH